MNKNPADQESHFSKWEAQKSPDRVAMTYDAAELARLREAASRFGFVPTTAIILALIDALEKTQGERLDRDPLADLIAERDSARGDAAKAKAKAHVKTLQILLDQECEHKNTAWAERDSARALLRKVAACGWVPPDLRASIEKELRQ